ncbi:hypothetical protein NEUTE2DRAFT_52757, partial [Neurospora tetrasperma FGSC 2509]
PAAGRTCRTYRIRRAFPITPSSDVTPHPNDHIRDLVGSSFQQQPLGQMAQWSTD